MKYGILGIGQAGLRHFNAFNNIKNVKLLGFTEFNLNKAKKFEKKFNVKHFKKLEDIKVSDHLQTFVVVIREKEKLYSFNSSFMSFQNQIEIVINSVEIFVIISA